MYAKYFGLAFKPFENTYDLRFLYLSVQHREVLFSLLYAVDAAKGFIMVSGEPGTGKTTLVNALLHELSPEHLVVHVINPRIKFEELFDNLARKLAVKVRGKNWIDAIDELREKLVDVNRQGKRVVILIDEAHLLSEESLEEIRLLSNIESEESKLVQIVMLGQNEIHSLLDKERHKPLKQRIAITRQLVPLGKNEAIDYISHRLKVAGQRLDLFEQGALDLIWQSSGGTPRLINHLCDNALVTGYAVGVEKIGRKIVEEVIADSKGALPRVHLWRNIGRKQKAWAACAAVLFLTVMVGVNGVSTKDNSVPSEVRNSPQQTIAEVADIAENTVAEMPAVELAALEESSEPGGYEQVYPSPPRQKRKISAGELISTLALKEYGMDSETVIDLIHMANKNIANIHQVYVGQEVVLPSIDRKGMVFSSKGGKITIHYASFYHLQAAQSALGKLSKQWENVSIVPTMQGENEVFRVFVGDFVNLDEAKKALDHIDFKNLPEGVSG